jgi:hypothetical protein
MEKTKKTIIMVILILFSWFLNVVAEEKPHFGTVIYTKTAGNYTYIKLYEEGKEVWLATSSIKVSAGDRIEYIGGVLMKNFHSKAMNKTFDSILLVTRIKILTIDKKSFPDDQYHKSISRKKQIVSIPRRGEIVKAKSDKTIEEVFLEREQLKDKVITVRAKVMKVSKNILGRNWVTLRDGTGIPPDDKLIATTSVDVNVGGIFTAKGILRTNVNIGAGYRYKVLLEDAEFIE